MVVHIVDRNEDDIPSALHHYREGLQLIGIFGLNTVSILRHVLHFDPISQLQLFIVGR